MAGGSLQKLGRGSKQCTVILHPPVLGEQQQGSVGYRGPACLTVDELSVSSLQLEWQMVNPIFSCGPPQFIQTQKH